MRILMTGERGAVGSYVKEAIAARYQDAEIVHLNDVDLRDRGDVLDALGDRKLVGACDVLVLGAATRLGGIRPQWLLTDDIAMTVNPLAALKPRGHIVYLSSALVYSGPGQNGVYEEDERDRHLFELRPTTDSIGLSRITCERAVKEYAFRERGTSTIWRLHNVISPREPHDDPAHVQVRLFADMVVRQMPAIQMVDDGFRQRCWTWVGDVASAIAGNLHVDAAKNATFNLGSGVPISVRRLAATMLRIAKEQGYVPESYTPSIQWAPGNSPAIPYPSSHLAELRLGFQAPTMLEDCMRKFLRGKAEAGAIKALGAEVAAGKNITWKIDRDKVRIKSVHIEGVRYVPDASVTDTDTWAAEVTAAAQVAGNATTDARDRDREVWRQHIATLLGPAGPQFLAGEIVECDTCREKIGSPELCVGCLANRFLQGVRRPS